MWFIGVEVEQETSAPPPKTNPASAPVEEVPPGGTGVNFCWVCAAGLSEPLPHYSLFCDQ